MAALLTSALGVVFLNIMDIYSSIMWDQRTTAHIIINFA